jgi:uncharacterized protein (TIGR02217 family)
MTIPAYRLPEYIERGSGFGPSWRNVIQEAISGNEQRFAQWTKCRGVGDLSWGLQSSADKFGDYAIIHAMFRAHFGSLYPFRFRDWGDYTATNEVFGTGDGTSTAFQLSKTYDPQYLLYGTAGAYFYVRDITLPTGTIVIKKANVIQTPSTDYNISSSGVVTFASAPATGAQLVWSGEFDVPVRFDSDTLPTVLNEADIVSIRTLPIKEVIGES